MTEIMFDLQGCDFKGDAVALVTMLSEILPKKMAPQYFSDNDEKYSKKNKVSDIDRFEKFLNSDDLFFCFNDEGYLHQIDMMDGSLNYSLWYLKAEDYQIVGDLFKTLIPVLTPTFGKCCEYEESPSRTILTLNYRSGETEISTSIGVASKFESLPGLFWYTLIPEALSDKYSLDWETIKSAGLDIQREMFTVDGRKYNLLKLYDSPEEWRGYANDIDDLCERTNGIFSVRPLQKETSWIKTIQDFNEFQENNWHLFKP